MVVAGIVIFLLYAVAVIVAALLGNQQQQRITARCLRRILNTFVSSPL